MMKMSEAHKKYHVEMQRRMSKTIQSNLILMKAKDKKRAATKMYLSYEEGKSLRRCTNNNAFILHQTYLQKADEVNCELTDKYMADILGWAEITVQRNRLLLEKANWFKKHTKRYTIRNNIRVDNIYMFTPVEILHGMTAVMLIAETEARIAAGTITQEELDEAEAELKAELEKADTAASKAKPIKESK